MKNVCQVLDLHPSLQQISTSVLSPKSILITYQWVMCLGFLLILLIRKI